MRKHFLPWFCIAAVVLAGAILFLVNSDSEPSYQGKTLGYWVNELKSTKPGARLEAEKALNALGPAAVPFLSGAVVKKPGIFARANEAFGKFLPEMAKRPVRNLFKPGQVVMDRYNAAEALKVLGTNAHAAAPALGRALNDPNVLISSAAGLALGRIGPEAVPYVLPALESGDYQVRANACSALALLGTNSAAAVPKLVQIVLTETGPIVSSAAYTLARIGRPAVPALLPLLGHTNWVIRRWGAYSLAYAGAVAQEAVTNLAPLIHDPNPQVRWMVVSAISKIDFVSKTAGEALLEATHDSDTNVQSMAVGELAGRPDVVVEKMPRFLELLNNPAASVRGQSAYAIGQTGQFASNALPSLRELLADPDPEVKKRAEKAIETIRASMAVAQ